MQVGDCGAEADVPLAVVGGAGEVAGADEDPFLAAAVVERAALWCIRGLPGEIVNSSGL